MSEGPQSLIDDCVGSAHGNFARVKEIIDGRPELVDAPATWGETALQAASQMGDKQMVEYLLEKGARLDFFAACMLGRFEEVVGFLATDPGLARLAGIHDLPSLYFAAVGGQTRICELLLGEGADVNAGAGGERPLHGAAMRGHLGTAEWLLDNGADVNAPGFENRTALALALKSNQVEMADLLRRRGAHD